MKKVNSFDIFDTLLARTVKNPIDIFKIVENEYPYKYFKRLRLKAQQMSNQTIDSIYKNFKKITKESDKEILMLREFELLIEKKNTIPIISNIKKIKDGDILVSDMYLSKKNIRELLDYHKINPKTDLYVSSMGKGTGVIWRKLIKEYKILNHTGDNNYSDIKMANNYGIKAELTELYKFTDLENELANVNVELCAIFRRFRLANPYDIGTNEYILYENQIRFNIPILVFLCRKLDEILIKENKNTVLFLSRDGCLIKKLFEKIFPQYKTIYFYSSRIINKNYNDEYIEYLKKNYDHNKCILFDLHGSFESGRKLYKKVFGILPRILIFDLNLKKLLYNGISYFSNVSGKIELFNLEYRGTLLDYRNNKFIFLPNEYNLYNVNIIHKLFNDFVKSINNPKILINNNIFGKNKYWRKFYINNIVINKDIDDSKLIFHHKYTLTQLNKKYNLTNNLIKYYEEFISDTINYNLKINNYNKLNLLQLGGKFNNLLVWTDYFYNNINVIGFGIKLDIIIFDKIYKNLKLIMGNKDDKYHIDNLTKIKYDIIIDNNNSSSLNNKKMIEIRLNILWDNLNINGFYVITNYDNKILNVQTNMKIYNFNKTYFIKKTL